MDRLIDMISASPEIKVAHITMQGTTQTDDPIIAAKLGMAIIPVWVCPGVTDAVAPIQIHHGTGLLVDNEDSNIIFDQPFDANQGGFKMFHLTPKAGPVNTGLFASYTIPGSLTRGTITVGYVLMPVSAAS